MKIRDGIVGLTVGDALGVPVEFKSREYLIENPVTGMMGHGTYDQPKGTWSDDTSLTLATMNSIAEKKAIDLEDNMMYSTTETPQLKLLTGLREDIL